MKRSEERKRGVGRRERGMGVRNEENDVAVSAAPPPFFNFS